jgi:16S rRNA (uracil1498-N3)-methyltransferase
MHQFFVKPSLEIKSKFNFDKDITHQIIKVLKLHTDEEILISDTRVMAVAHLSIEKDGVYAIVDHFVDVPKQHIEVTLIQALIRKEKFELILQKATELGVHRIVPLIMERNVVKWDQDSNKLDRYKTILKEAAEQCHRLNIPQLMPPIMIKELETYKSDLNFVAYEGEDPSRLLKHALTPSKSVSIIIGPEGGISLNEIKKLEALGFILVSLGPRIYRAETAAFVAINTIDCVLGL